MGCGSSVGHRARWVAGHVPLRGAPRASLQESLGGGTPPLRSAGGRVPADPAPAAPPPGGIIERGAQEPRVGCRGPVRACCAARLAFVRRPSPPAPWSAPRRRAPSRCRCCCSAASRCWRPEVGAPRAHGPTLGPQPGPVLTESLHLPVLRSAGAAPQGSSHGPQSCVESRPGTSSPQPRFRLGPNALL